MSLHENETRKRAFGAYAEEYDAVRPRYPAALLAAVARYAGIGQEATSMVFRSRRAEGATLT